MKIFNYFLKHSCLLVGAAMLVAMAGCSGCDKNGDKRAELLKHVGDDAVAIATINVQKLLESAGGTFEDGKITLPDNLEKIVKDYGSKSDKKTLDYFASMEGVNLQSVVMAVYGNDSDGTYSTYMLYITNEGDFDKWVKDVGFDEDKVNDYKCYSYDKRWTQIVMDDDIAYLFTGQEDASDAVDLVKDIKKSIEKNSLAEWKVDFLCAENKAMTGLVFLNEISDVAKELDKVNELNDDARVLAVDVVLDGLHLQANCKVLDKNGKPADVVKAANFKSLNPNIFTYFPTDYNIFGAISLDGKWLEPYKDELFSSMNSELIQMLYGDNIASYYKPKYDEYGNYMYEYYNTVIDGINEIVEGQDFKVPSEHITTLGFGAGISSGATIDYNNPMDFVKYISSRSVLSFTSDTYATDYYKAWKDLNMIGEQGDDQILEFSPYISKFKVYMMRKSKDIILSSARKFETAAHSFPCKLDEALAFCQINIPVDDPLIKALPLKVNFGLKVWALVTRNSFTIDITLTDAEGGFLQNTLDLSKSIGSMYGLRGYDDEAPYESPSYDTYPDYYDDSTAMMEEVVVEEAPADSSYYYY